MVEITPRENQEARARKHGESYSPEYRIWRGLVNRCTRLGDPAWRNYGGRGITVCPEWEFDFFEFLGDMGRRPSPGHELDRRDNEQGYSRLNCRWVSRKVNSRNRRSARIVTFQGKRMCLAAACELGGASYSRVQARLNSKKRCWSVDEAILTPARPKAKDGEGLPQYATKQTNATGFKGVKRKRSGFVGRLILQGKRLESPAFSTAEEAHAWVETQRAKKRAQET
jgi:hypothetical protein